jgi:hypothetical protein
MRQGAGHTRPAPWRTRRCQPARRGRRHYHPSPLPSSDDNVPSTSSKTRQLERRRRDALDSRTLIASANHPIPRNLRDFTRISRGRDHGPIPTSRRARMFLSVLPTEQGQPKRAIDHTAGRGAVIQGLCVAWLSRSSSPAAAGRPYIYALARFRRSSGSAAWCAAAQSKGPRESVIMAVVVLAPLTR